MPQPSFGPNLRNRLQSEEKLGKDESRHGRGVGNEFVKVRRSLPLYPLRKFCSPQGRYRQAYKSRFLVY